MGNGRVHHFYSMDCWILLVREAAIVVALAGSLVWILSPQRGWQNRKVFSVSCNPSCLCFLMYRKHWKKPQTLRLLGTLLSGFWIKFTVRSTHRMSWRERNKASIIHEEMVNRLTGFTGDRWGFPRGFWDCPLQVTLYGTTQCWNLLSKEFYFYLCSLCSSNELVSLLASDLNPIFL